MLSVTSDAQEFTDARQPTLVYRLTIGDGLDRAEGAALDFCRVACAVGLTLGPIDFVQSVGGSTSLKRRYMSSSQASPFRFSGLLFSWSLKHRQAHQQAKVPTMSTRIEASMIHPAAGRI
jgi:hypothetical protein